jgi:hypothetical protein
MFRKRKKVDSQKKEKQKRHGTNAHKWWTNYQKVSLEIGDQHHNAHEW